MIARHTNDQQPLPPARHPDLDEIREWIAAWPTIRADVGRLLEDSVHIAAGHETAPFLVLIDEIDTSMRLLQHRVGWLNDLLVKHGK